jgi:prolyl-tRNA editing enzyme YbaK/EbsC (Cys-tRNA(Pro) deacylase)
MKPATNATALRVQALLGAQYEVLELDESTRSAAEAAAAIGCQVAQIAKSLIFRTVRSDRSVLVVASGVNRVDEETVAELVGDPIEQADPKFVRERTGFSIGGVPPVGHSTPPITIIDEGLRQFDIIWAAAGTPRSVFALTPDQLAAMTGATYSRIIRR